MKNKVLFGLLLVSLFSSVLPLPACAKAQGWYVPKCGNRQPDLPDEEKYIQNHHGYYLDTGVTDTSERRVIYLTFDAGYENGNVEKVLDTLKEKNVQAAFFILDHMVLHNTELVKRMADEGHLVCNHTKNHKDMTCCSEAEMKKNLTDLEKIYEEKTGKQLDKFFRFPEGRFDEKTICCAESLGYKTVFWSFAYADWDNGKQPNPDAAVKKILANTHNGEVILLHPTSATNAAILSRLIDSWREMGYSFGNLNELVTSVETSNN